MRESDYPKVLRRGVAGMIILLLLLLLFGAFAPAAMATVDWPNCDWGCTANDTDVTRAWLGNCTTRAELEPCTPGPIVEACIFVNFSNTASSDRYQAFVLFDLYINYVYDSSIEKCVVDTIPNGASTHNVSTLDWTCGDRVELRNFILTWTTNDCNCTDDVCCTGDTPPCSCKHQSSKCYAGNITVEAPLVANFTFDNVCFCTYTTFTDKTTGGHGSYNWSWDFDDGNGSYEQNPTHHYGKNGTYNVNLTVTDSDSPTKNTDSQIYAVEVYQNPTANFTSNSPQIYYLNITFTDTTTNGTLSYKNWSWDFGDGNGSYEQNPRHQYGASGTYYVNLTVTDAKDCINSTIKTVVALDYTADLKITKEANVSSATVGDIIKYWYNVTNTGNVNLTGIVVNDSRLGIVTLEYVCTYTK